MILIVGAGVSGLSTARFLNNHGVPFLIFDQAPEQRLQGFGVTLRAGAVSLLQDLLRIDGDTLRKEVAVDRQRGFMSSSISDAQNGNMYQGAGYTSEHSGDFRGNRERLRSTIQGSMEILFNHKLKAVQRTPDGVKVTFENGKSYYGDLLVAADGVYSSARTIFAPHCKPKDFPCIVMSGSFTISGSEFDRCMRHAMQGSSVQLGVIDRTLLAATVYDTEPNGNMMICWVRSRLQEGEDDSLFVPYWIKRDRTIISPKFWEELESLPKLIEPFEYVFHGPNIRRGRAIQQQLVSLLIPMEELESIWREQKVVFVGDSARDWSHHAGSGASTAIVDGINLGQTLLAQHSVESWYRKRFPVWQQEIERSNRDCTAIHCTQEEWQARVAVREEVSLTAAL